MGTSILDDWDKADHGTNLVCIKQPRDVKRGKKIVVNTNYGRKAVGKDGDLA